MFCISFDGSKSPSRMSMVALAPSVIVSSTLSLAVPPAPMPRSWSSVPSRASTYAFVAASLAAVGVPRPVIVAPFALLPSKSTSSMFCISFDGSKSPSRMSMVALVPSVIVSSTLSLAVPPAPIPRSWSSVPSRAESSASVAKVASNALSLISISISSLPASLVIVIRFEPALIFLNSKSAPVFLANVPTPAIPTFEAVFV